MSLRLSHVECSLFHILTNAICSMVEMAQNMGSGDVNLNLGSVIQFFFCLRVKQWQNYVFRKHKSVYSKVLEIIKESSLVIGYKICM